jgi:mannosyltransferase
VMKEYLSTATKPESLFTAKAIVGLLLLMIGAVLLSVFVFSKSSLRLDEAQSLFQVSRDFPGLLFQIAQDVHVPGYHTLLQGWVNVFDNDVRTARYLSLAFFIAIIPAVYYLGAMIFNRRVGMLAALLVTISPFMQWYGSEVRMYSMLAFVTVIHQILFLKVFKQGKALHWFWYVLVTIIGLYTHYFFAFVILTEVLFYLLFKRQFKDGSFKKFFVAAIVALAAFVPWLWYVQSLGTASNTQPSLGVPSSGDLFNTYAQFLFGFQVDALNTIIVSLWPIIVLLAFFALQKNHKVTPQAIFFVMAAIVPVLGAYLLSVTVRPFYLSRYLIVALPALMILLAWIISIYPVRVRRFLQIGLIVTTLGLLYLQVVNPSTPVKEDYRAATTYLEQYATSRDVIVVAAPFTIYPIEYYYKGPAKLTTQPIWDRFSKGPVPPYNADTVKKETDKNVLDYQYAWVLLSYDQGYNAKLRTYYDSRFERVSRHEFSPKLVAYKYKIRYDPEVKIDQ